MDEDVPRLRVGDAAALEGLRGRLEDRLADLEGQGDGEGCFAMDVEAALDFLREVGPAPVDAAFDDSNALRAVLLVTGGDPVQAVVGADEGDRY